MPVRTSRRSTSIHLCKNAFYASPNTYNLVEMITESEHSFIELSNKLLNKEGYIQLIDAFPNIGLDPSQYDPWKGPDY